MGDRRYRRDRFPRRHRPVGAVVAEEGQAFAASPQRLHQLRAEPPQPGRRDDRSEGTDRVLQRPLSRDLRARARRRPPTAWTDRHCWSCAAAAACSMSASRISTAGPPLPKASSPNCRTARRSGQVFHAAQWRVGRDPSGLHRSAQDVAKAGIDHPVPGIGARQRSGMRGRQEHPGRPLHLRQPRLRALLAVLPGSHRRQARRRDLQRETAATSRARTVRRSIRRQAITAWNSRSSAARRSASSPPTA